MRNSSHLFPDFSALSAKAERARTLLEQAQQMAQTAREMALEDHLTRERIDAVRAELADMRDRLDRGAPLRHPRVMEAVPPTCPECGQPQELPAPGPCPHCDPGAWERAQENWSDAQQRWMKAREARASAERERALAQKAWDEAQASWETAVAAWSSAQHNFDYASEAAEQSEIEWEGAQSAWEEAERIHERQVARAPSPEGVDA